MPPIDEEIQIQPPEGAPTEGLGLAASLIREFFVDFLGSLVPGFLFTMFAAPMAIWTGAEILHGPLKWQQVLSSVNSLGYAPFLLILVVSYVLGCVFARRDPKVADQKSLAYILRKDWAGMSRGVVQPRAQDAKDHKAKLDGILKKKALMRWLSFLEFRQFTKHLAHSEGGQFPYSHLYEYLSSRGLDHLARHVPWQGVEESISKRSKMFINVLKIRVQSWNPRLCGDIIRNEAHVRMMSSVWYAAQQLQRVYIVILALLLLDGQYRGAWKLPTKLDPPLPSMVIIFASLITLLIAATLLRKAIVTFLHYQRVREIVYVLETAHFALRQGYKTIFEGLEDGQDPTPGNAVP